MRLPSNPRRVPIRALTLVTLCGLAGFAAGCRGVEVMGTAGATGGTTILGTGGGTGRGMHAPALVGRWARTVVLTGIDGDLHESRTEWEFGADGRAVRRVTAWNVSQGIFDTLVAVAQWQTSGSTITIAWLSPTVGTATFEWRISGDVLTLGPDRYARVR